ncbi:D-aminoacyl-tRNA deacylase [Oceanispirochaeta sp.]|jgi:D-tyrosyl-tRNA(Tyr) deacylase|uniref:D-aminoacyl-tRNA deacylase n=1 Tax=Oceanispirochaeta sp. TaxID=2035350 RepID=UPI00261DBEAA|nr:D-aminoacyl-tRNA deacylase [Oceanispirochaeta sp.]MDA3958845.1 D-aminoacyl-tRNA deacylase [Oceanispirochaeta sp.]
MKAVLQRVSRATVTIDRNETRSIGPGLLILLGISHEDTKEDIHWLTGKISGMRIFTDPDGKMNLSVQDIKGEILVVSQFTLFASTKKGNRPSFNKAAPPELAIPLYNDFVSELRKNTGLHTETGEFGAYMEVQLCNDGPVTILIDSKNRE